MCLLDLCEMPVSRWRLDARFLNEEEVAGAVKRAEARSKQGTQERPWLQRCQSLQEMELVWILQEKSPYSSSSSIAWSTHLSIIVGNYTMSPRYQQSKLCKPWRCCRSREKNWPMETVQEQVVANEDVDLVDIARSRGWDHSWSFAVQSPPFQPRHYPHRFFPTSSSLLPHVQVFLCVLSCNASSRSTSSLLNACQRSQVYLMKISNKCVRVLWNWVQFVASFVAGQYQTLSWMHVNNFLILLKFLGVCVLWNWVKFVGSCVAGKKFY